MGSIDNGGHGSMMRFAIDRLAGRDLRDIALKAQVELDEGNGNRASLSFDTFGTRVRLSCRVSLLLPSWDSGTSS